MKRIEHFWGWADFKFRYLAEYCMRRAYHHRMVREHAEADLINRTFEVWDRNAPYWKD